MSANGRLTAAELSPIPGGQLSNEAAAAWNAPGGPADNGLRPLGGDSSYRPYDRQEYYWDLYQSGQGNLAAYPGTSNHGLGVAVDLAEPWMRTWIDEHGHKFGWAKTEAMSEWWHVNYIGGFHGAPSFRNLHKGSEGPRVRELHKLLRHAGGVLADKSGKRRRRFRYWRGPWHKHYGNRTVKAVKKFQGDHHLGKDGIVGEHTWHKLRQIGRLDAQ